MILIEAGLLVARHRLEHTPPEEEAGVTLLLRHGLSITDDPRIAAIIKSCLITLLGIEPRPKKDDAAEIPDEVFDVVTDWQPPDRTRVRESPHST